MQKVLPGIQYFDITNCVIFGSRVFSLNHARGVEGEGGGGEQYSRAYGTKTRQWTSNSSSILITGYRSYSRYNTPLAKLPVPVACILPGIPVQGLHDFLDPSHVAGTSMVFTGAALAVGMPGTITHTSRLKAGRYAPTAVIEA